MLRLAEAFASPKQLLDRTLPVVAMMAGGKVTAVYRQVFGELLIEDLWLPCFVVSSGLSRAAAVVHQRGPVWRAVRASTAIPAIFPPLLGDDGEVLIDGGVMNNMPLDVMRELCEGGTVIGVNPMPAQDKMKAYHFGPSLSGWRALLGRLRLFGVRTRAPSILGSVMRATEINSANRMRQPSFRALADLLLEPPVEGFPILAFDKYAPIIDIGYGRPARRSRRGRRRAPATPRPGRPRPDQQSLDRAIEWRNDGTQPGDGHRHLHHRGMGGRGRQPGGAAAVAARLPGRRIRRRPARLQVGHRRRIHPDDLRASACRCCCS